MFKFNTENLVTWIKRPNTNKTDFAYGHGKEEA